MVKRYIRLPNGQLVQEDASGYIRVKVGMHLEHLMLIGEVGALPVLSEKATGSKDLSDISYTVVSHSGNELVLEVRGRTATIDVEPVEVNDTILPMVEFNVEVVRSSFAVRTFKAMARTKEEAIENAAEDAGNHLYSEQDTEYEVNAGRAK